MKKNYLIVFLLLCTAHFYGQDSIVNYLDFYGEKTRKSKAFSVETIVKKDTVWEYVKYYRSGKIEERGQYENKNKKKPVGTFYEFFRSKNLKSFYAHNDKGQLSGNTKMWFDNKAISLVGNYKDGKKIGIWKYYHYNGKLACKQYFQNFKAVKTVFYDEQGQKKVAELIKFQRPKFEGGGMDKFQKRIKEVHNRIRFQIVGNVYLNFTIGVDGRIRDFSTSDKIPIQLERRLRIYFEGIIGWEPAIHMNRKIPYTYTLPLDFFVTFTR